MPAAFHISEDEGLITVQVDDSIELAEFFQTAQALASDPSYDPALPLLADLRGMRIDLDGEALEPFNRFMVSTYGRDRLASTAVVVDHEMDRKLCAAIYWLSCALGRCEMFDDYDHALKWLIRREFAGAL
jgi:hypothetical protein